MKRTFFLKAVSGIDDDLIFEADPGAEVSTANAKNKRMRPVWRTFGGIAAALVVVCGVWAAHRGGLVSMDAMQEAAVDDAEHIPADDYYYTADMNGAPLETEIAVDKSQTAEEDMPTADTAAGTRLTEVAFTFFEGGRLYKEIRQYPDGVPDAKTVLNDYLTAAGVSIRCTAVAVTSTEPKMEVQGGVVSYTPGVRTATVTFTADPGDDLLIGALRVLNQLWTARYYHFETEDGARLQIGDILPETGYDPRDYLQ